MQGSALLLAPDCINARHNLGTVLYQTGRMQEALPHIRYVLKKYPNDKTSLDMLANIEGRGKSPPQDKSPQYIFANQPQN